jgi:ribosomal protein S18 acetylase RimI-like enzyme
MQESNRNLKKQRIRNFFSSFEIASRETKEESVENKIINEGLAYIQMKLPVAMITPELEKNLQEKVERNILKAKVREASREDLESVMHIHNRSWMVSNTPFTPISIDSLEIINEYPETIILVAKVYGEDAGFVILDFEGESKDIGVIAGLGVLPRFQRKGLGTVLGMAAWRYFKKKGVKSLKCEVYKENTVSYNFIKSLGFEEYDTKVYNMDDFAPRD